MNADPLVPGLLELVVGALLVLVPIAVILGVVLLRRRRQPPTAYASGVTAADGLPPDVLALRQEVAALRAEMAGTLRHLAVARYDAFPDMGGHLSWSLALLDDSGDGVVITSIHGRSDARSYAKQIAGWRSEQQLSAEEEQAVAQART